MEAQAAKLFVTALEVQEKASRKRLKQMKAQAAQALEAQEKASRKLREEMEAEAALREKLAAAQTSHLAPRSVVSSFSWPEGSVYMQWREQVLVLVSCASHQRRAGVSRVAWHELSKQVVEEGMWRLVSHTIAYLCVSNSNTSLSFC